MMTAIGRRNWKGLVVAVALALGVSGCAWWYQTVCGTQTTQASAESCVQQANMLAMILLGGAAIGIWVASQDRKGGAVHVDAPG
jgi:hypothetical protein